MSKAGGSQSPKAFRNHMRPAAANRLVLDVADDRIGNRLKEVAFVVDMVVKGHRRHGEVVGQAPEAELCGTVPIEKHERLFDDVFSTEAGAHGIV